MSEGLRAKPLSMKTVQEPQPGLDEKGERKKRKNRKKEGREQVGGGVWREIKEGKELEKGEES